MTILLRKYKFFIILILAVLLVREADLVIQKNLELKHARQTARLLKTLCYWEKHNTQPRRELIAKRVFNIDLYYEAGYLGQDYIFQIFRTKDNSYFNIMPYFQGFTVTPHAFYADADSGKIYCLALKDNDAARRLCQKLGPESGPEENVVNKDLPIPYAPLMYAYPLDTSSYEPMF